MALCENYREEYFNRLLRCLDLVQKSEKYDATFADYSDLCLRINSRLADKGVVVTDCEQLLDGRGGLKPIAEIILSDDAELLALLRKLAGLFAVLCEISGGSEDYPQNKSIYIVLAIADYKDLEREILSTLGKDLGEQVIYEEQLRISGIERERGLSFFSCERDRFETLCRLRVLNATHGELMLSDTDSADELELTLEGEFGDRFNFKKTGQIRHGGALFVELVLLDDIPSKQKLMHYLVKSTSDGLILTLVEDKRLSDLLYERIDALIV